MAHRHKKGEIGEPGVDIGRRAALFRFGLGISAAYAAPVLLSLGTAQAGVVVGDPGDGGEEHQKPGNGDGHGYGHYKGRGEGHEKEHGGARQGKKVTVKELLDYLANIGKRKK